MLTLHSSCGLCECPHFGMSKSLHMECSTSSPFSLTIRTRRSTAIKTEFHLVWFGRISMSPHVSWTVSAAREDLPALFQMAWHFAKVERDNFLYVVLSSACFVSVVQTRLREWHAHLW